MKVVTKERIRSHAFKSVNSAIINEGHNAFLVAKTDGRQVDGIKDNPYPFGDERCVAWYIGWRDARDFYERAYANDIPDVLMVPYGTLAEPAN